MGFIIVVIGAISVILALEKLFPKRVLAFYRWTGMITDSKERIRKYIEIKKAHRR